MHHLLDKILQRRGTAHDLAKLEELCDMVKNTSLCGLGQTAPNPTLSTLRFFRNEYLELLK
jgi:bidirectional [NiFe] hydrogenase diaphorase subunit